jgi:hypothetical protein
MQRSEIRVGVENALEIERAQIGGRTRHVLASYRGAQIIHPACVGAARR